MVPLCNMVTPWALNTRSVVGIAGCAATVAAFTPAVVAPTTNFRVQLKTLSLVSRSSRSCETFNFQVKPYFTVYKLVTW